MTKKWLLIPSFILSALLCNSVFAVGKVDINQCNAIYSEETGELNIPCLNIETGDALLSHSATLLKNDSGQFNVASVLEVTEVNTACTATYQVETDLLSIPCLQNEGDDTIYASIFEQVNEKSFSMIFSEEKDSRQIRRSMRRKINWDVPYLSQRSYPNIGESACGPTSTAMLLRYFYPNSYIDMPEVYHSGTQAYQYKSGSANGYKNVGFAKGDSGLSIISYQNRKYFAGNYSGMSLNHAKNYLRNIWSGSVKDLTTVDAVYNAIKESPLLGHVWAHGNTQWGHYVVIRGIDDKGTSNRSDDTIYVNDPYNVWNRAWDNSGNNKALSYSTFFIKGRYGSKWFRDATQFIPEESATKRKYSVLVDTGHNSFGGNAQNHSFMLDYPDRNWKFYYSNGGDWYYPERSDAAARWTPRISKKGYYKVSARFRGDRYSGNVTYSIYDIDGRKLKTKTINQNRTSAQWINATIADEVLLDVSVKRNGYWKGHYVRADKIAKNSNIDAVKFTFIREASSQPSSPSKITATQGIYSTKIFVDWDRVNSANEYRVYRNTNSSRSSAKLVKTTSSSSYYDHSVTAGKNYYYWVKAVNSSGSSNYSAYAQGYAKKASSNSSPSNLEYDWSGNASLISYHGLNRNLGINETKPFAIYQDQTKLHSSLDNPIAFFQWQADSQKCKRLKIYADSHTKVKANITIGPWDNRDKDEIFKNVTLPFVIGKENTNIQIYSGSSSASNWFVLSVAPTSNITDTTGLYAECTTDVVKSYPYTVKLDKPIMLKGGYRWGGTASVISHNFRNHFSDKVSTGSNQWPYGAFKDITVVRRSGDKPVVFFQWQISPQCRSIEFAATDTKKHPQNVDVSLIMKPWSKEKTQYQKTVELPYTVNYREAGLSSDYGHWAVIQLAFKQPATKTLNISASCTNY